MAGGNTIIQRCFIKCRTPVEISDSQYAGHNLVKTRLSTPFNMFLLRKKGAKRVDSTHAVLTIHGADTLEAINENTKFKWDQLGPLAEFASRPEDVLNAWRNKFTFRTEDEECNSPGLRTPQIGALHAISAHFSVGKKFEPATVTLPTGTGKTETMLAMAVYLRLPKILVIVPSAILRTQIEQKFANLGILPQARVVPAEIVRPRVCKMTKALKRVEDAATVLKQSNVIVALPNTLRASDPESLAHLFDGCTDLIVDEAHHVPASSWAEIRDRFHEKRITQFTATPFRRDNKRVDGKIIFNFKLGDAQASGYYRRINLKTVEEYGDDEECDRQIAKAAVEALRHDRNELGLDHLLMARTQTKERANAVVNLYRKLAADLKPQVIYTGMGPRANKDALDALLDRGSEGARIIVCVDMLGEGFDLPNLKIAALHDTHKSLALTLQFIGRFTRKGDKDSIGEATVIANIADPQTERKLANLYAEGADWDALIKRLSEERIEDELKLQDVVLDLKQKGDLHDHLSLWNLRPSLSTQIYRTKCADWHPENFAQVLPRDAERWHALSEAGNILAAVVYRSSTVKWGNYQNLFDASYDLVLAYWDREAQALFMYSSDYNGLHIEKMAQEITDERTDLVHGPSIFNILNNVELPLVKSLGSSRIGAISFTSYFGPNVTDGLASIEVRESALNNIACLGYEDGERVLWGCTQRKGKIWQQSSGTISEWLAWCKKTWGKVSNDEHIDANITRDFLRPQKLDKAHPSVPISIQWGEHIQQHFNDKQFFQFGDVEQPLYLTDLEIVSVAGNGDITFKIFTESYASDYVLRINDKYLGGYEYCKVSGPDVFFRTAHRDPISIVEYLQRDPFIVRYVDGTYSYNSYHIPVPLETGAFPKEQLEVWNWDRIPLNRESMHKDGATDTIQYHSFERIKDDYDLIFNDDGCGEAADLVALNKVDDKTIRLCLVHCKGAKGAQVSNNIENFYTVCGQAQKSIAVKHRGIQKLYLDLKRRQESWAKTGANRFLKGDMKTLTYFKDMARKAKLEFEVIIVQPGGSAANLSDDILRLLGTTELFLSKTSKAEFRVVVSA